MPLRNNPAIWHSMPGVVVAYQPIAAPGPLMALWNMAHRGHDRYFAVPSVAPAWDIAAGWTFDPTQYLLSAAVPTSQSWSMLVQFSNGPTSGYSSICGAQLTYTVAVGLSGCWGGSAAIYFNGTDGVYLYIAPAQTAGNLAYAGLHAYRNGIAESGTFTPGWAGTLTNITIAGSGAGAGEGWTGSIQAYALIDRVLSDAEVWLASQQMAYCHVNPRWNVWTPARRWFFSPPPPAAATPVLSTIYINSADIGDTSLFDDVSGAAVSASYARTGTNSFKLASGDYLQADLTSSATKYTKFGLLVTDAPSADHLLVAWQETGTEHVSLYLTKDLQLQMLQGERIIQTSPTTLEIEQWYCVETKIVVHDTIGRFQVRIDGVDDMTAIGINTDDDVGGTINEIRFESPVDDTYIDDIVVREDQWCGAGGVYVVVPAAAGQADEWSGSYADVDELPPSFADYISATPLGSSESTFRHQGLTIDYAQMPIVGVFAKARINAAADAVAYAAAFSNEEFATGDAQELDETGVYARLLMTTNPDGSAAWTAAAVGAMEIGIKA